MSPSATARYLALDGVRGIAALLVVFFHIQWPNHLTSGAVVRNAYLAVDLFFILSGFVIAANYSTKIANLADIRNFIYLRFARIYPLHIATLLLLVCLEVSKLIVQNAVEVAPAHAAFADGNSIASLAANVLLLQGLGPLDELGWNTPSWSISCEFAAYFLFALAGCAGILRSRICFVVGLVLACATYGTIVLTRETLDVTYDWGLLRCLAGFFFGVAVHQVSAGGQTRRMLPQWSTSVVGVGEFGLLIALIGIMSFAEGAAVVLAIPLFIAAIALLQFDCGLLARGLATRPLQYLGRISYSIYMVHIPILIFFSIFLKRVVHVPVALDPSQHVPIFVIDPWIGDLFVIAVIAIVVATAAITYSRIEQPGQRIGHELLVGLADRLKARTVKWTVFTRP